MVEESAEKVFLNYGVLGVLCGILLWTVMHLYRARSKDQKEYVAKLEELMAKATQTQKDQAEAQTQALAAMAAEHKAEMTALEARYIRTFETTTEKYYELQKSMMEFMIEMKHLVNVLVKQTKQ